MTGDNWNAVMTDAADFTSHWAMLYFIAAIVFGQFILLNLFVAILLSQMESEGEDKWMREDVYHFAVHLRRAGTYRQGLHYLSMRAAAKNLSRNSGYGLNVHAPPNSETIS